MMNLRQARREDYWRKLFNRNYPFIIEKILFQGGVLFDGMEVFLKPGINVFVGRNGIGKSNLIRSLYNLFFCEQSNQSPFSTPLVEPDGVTARLTSEDNPIECSDVSGFMFDPCYLIPDIQLLFNSQENLEELLEQFSPQPIVGDDLQLLNYLTNSSYESVSIRSIEDEFQDYAYLPFFEVSIGGRNYDSRGMGLGELSLFYFFWLMTRISLLDGARIVFIEEPESFLPPSIQLRLVDVLALYGASLGLPIVLSTHSEHILKRVERSHVHILRKEHTGVRCATASDELEPLRLLGLSSPKVGVLMYEDYAAGCFIKALLKKSNKYVADGFYFYCCNSNGQILNRLKNFHDSNLTLKFVGVFDGDCRNSMARDLKNISHFTFLPSEDPPESLLIDMISGMNIAEISSTLSCTDTKAHDALDRTAGADIHDFLPEFARAIEMDIGSLLPRLCDTWVIKNEELSQAFLSDFEKLMT